MLEIRDLSVNIRGTSILDGIGLDLAAGRILVLIGPNGAGKTTLLRAINGWVKPTSGKVELNGCDVLKMSRREVASQIAVVAQESETRFPISVEQFVLCGQFTGGGALGWERPDDVERAVKAITDCGLEDLSSQMMDRLSGGERQRVVLARALATRADLLLLDEPTANLDLRHQETMLRLVQNRCRASGAAAIVVTHDLNLGAAFADDMLILKDGRVVSCGRPVEVLTSETIWSVFGMRAIVDAEPRFSSVRVMSLFETEAT